MTTKIPRELSLRAVNRGGFCQHFADNTNEINDLLDFGFDFGTVRPILTVIPINPMTP